MTDGAANWGAIKVRGARENNLRDVSLDIPKRQLTVFTGVSGSGKSSLVFETIAAESRRLINETYTAFLQGFMGTPARPDVDSLENLSAAIVVDQERMGTNARSTVGTVTDAYDMLRVIFSRLGKPHIGPSSAFSFNVPAGTISGEITLEKGRSETESREITITGGMCAECEGLGRVSSVDIDALVDRDKSLNDGAIIFPGFGVGTWYHRIYVDSGFFDPDKPLRDFTDAEWQRLLYGETTKVKFENFNLTYEGLVDKIRSRYLVKDADSLQPTLRAAVERIATFTDCPACGGTRLNDLARSSLIGGKNIAECSGMQISDLAAWIRSLDEPGAGPMLDHLGAVLDTFVQIGLGYLSLDRESSTLSGGESQRTRMVRHLGSSLTDLTYVFDEPTIGLHAHDVEQMNGLLQRLRDKGNTVLVVEHDPEVMRVADHVVDMGPGAGSHGGEVVFEGTYDELAASGTTTGQHLEVQQSLKEAVRTATGADPDPQRPAPQPAGRIGRRADRRLRRRHRRGGIGQELAHPRLPAAHRSVRHRHRPIRHPRLASIEPRHLHRHPRPDSQGVRIGQRREAGAVQRELGGRLPGVQGARAHLHRPRLHGGRRQRVRGVRGPPIHR